LRNYKWGECLLGAITALGIGLLAWSTQPAHAVTESKIYDVVIWTGTEDGAGTNANVKITLYGTQSPEGTEAKAVRSGGKNFVKGRKEYYKVQIDEAVGLLEAIKLEHDDSGWGSAWYVDKVRVDDVNNDKNWVYFTFDRWLGDGSATYATKKRDDYAAWQKEYARQIPVPEGSWTKTCSGGHRCSEQLTRSFSVSGSKSTTWSNTFKAGLKYTYTRNNVGEGGAVLSSHKLEASVEDAFTKTREIAEQHSTGFSQSCQNGQEFQDYFIAGVYQWTTTTRVEGREVTIKTCEVACSPTGHPPKYFPGDPLTIDSCDASKKDFAMIPDAAIDGHNTETIQNFTVARCQQSCRDRSWCKTFDFKRSSNICYLQSVNEGDLVDEKRITLKRDYKDNPYDFYYMPERVKR